MENGSNRSATLRARLAWWAPAIAALLLAWLARHLVIEPQAIAHACDPAPWSGWCAGRSALIRTFSSQQLGWLSLAAGVAAVVRHRSLPARVATASGAAGLVLYCFEPAAVGLLLGAVASCRLPAGHDDRPKPTAQPATKPAASSHGQS